MAGPLKLMAQSREDLEVISAVLQDAAVRIGDIAHLAKQKRFALVASRYRWETVAGQGGKRRRRRTGERVRTGVHFQGVLKAESQNVPMEDERHVMELLAIEVKDDAGDGVVITLDFSGYATIRLTVECIEAYLKDLGEPWLAMSRPAHAID